MNNTLEGLRLDYRVLVIPYNLRHTGANDLPPIYKLRIFGHQQIFLYNYFIFSGVDISRVWRAPPPAGPRRSTRLPRQAAISGRVLAGFRIRFFGFLDLSKGDL